MSLQYKNRIWLAVTFIAGLFVLSNQATAASVYTTSGTLIISDPNISNIFEITTAGTYQADFNYSFVLSDEGWADVAGMTISDSSSNILADVLGVGSFIFDAQPGFYTLEVYLDPLQLFYGIDYSTSISAVPLPAPLLLFATSLFALLGFKRVSNRAA